MKNRNRFLLSISACLMIAMATASDENQLLESRVLEQLRVRQQELPSEIAQTVQHLVQTPEQLAQEGQEMGLSKEELEQIKDPVILNFANAKMKLDVAQKKAELLSANEQISLLTTKEPAAKYAQLKELLEKRDQLETKTNAMRRAFTLGTEEEMKAQSSNWENHKAELKTVNQQIMQLTTPAGTVPAIQTLEKEEEAASEAFRSMLSEKMEPAFQEAFEKADEKNQKESL